ncbi:hypothetical protein [Flavobacterium sp. NKUCC04_CG]|uniref:hypothetical protein n=1 Tax=Flavobacterium sp. NKUCC04_CG TaxID=2842121 RepID=UPI001C5BD8F2|nr:hypothetical protein [Flavobacterium sp. NKUCC04_CG]MBW3518189.1 hypothetical protein [Flavobacterium sp. NKUCC04_CG]
MNKFTSADYIKAVKEAIEEAKKNSEYDYILLNPSPAKLRDICMAIYSDSPSSSDKKIFEHFFKLDLRADLTSQFLNFNVDKLRPVRNFIIGDSGRPSFMIVELLAVLADFEKRPLGKFLGSNTGVVENKVEDVKEHTIVKEELRINSPLFVSTKNKKEGLVIAALLFVVFLGGLCVNGFQSDKPDCVYWSYDYYELIDCESRVVGVTTFHNILPVEQYIWRYFKEIEGSPPTVFFQNGKTIIWYGKNTGGSYEYFTNTGEHSEIGKQLKPVTNIHLGN